MPPPVNGCCQPCISASTGPFFSVPSTVITWPQNISSSSYLSLIHIWNIVFINSGGRFRESFPAAKICNLVHEAPTFVVVSLDMVSSGPAPGPCQRHWLPHRLKIPHCFPAGRSPQYPDREAGHFPKPVHQMHTRLRPESILPDIPWSLSLIHIYRAEDAPCQTGPAPHS